MSSSAPQICLGGLERAAAGEDGEPGEEPLLVRVQEVVRPLDRRAQRLLSRLGVAAASEQVEPGAEPFEELVAGEHHRSRRGKLERERQVVEALAEQVERVVGRKSWP